MKESTSNGHQILWDGSKVWINSKIDSSSIGRFSARGVDIHRTAQEQLEHGEQCLDCSDDGSYAGWVAFAAGMLEHYGVEIPIEARPEYLRARSEDDCKALACENVRAWVNESKRGTLSDENCPFRVESLPEQPGDRESMMLRLRVVDVQKDKKKMKFVDKQTQKLLEFMSVTAGVTGTARDLIHIYAGKLDIPLLFCFVPLFTSLLFVVAIRAFKLFLQRRQAK